MNAQANDQLADKPEAILTEQEGTFVAELQKDEALKSVEKYNDTDKLIEHHIEKVHIEN